LRLLEFGSASLWLPAPVASGRSTDTILAVRTQEATENKAPATGPIPRHPSRPAMSARRHLSDAAPVRRHLEPPHTDLLHYCFMSVTATRLHHHHHRAISVWRVLA
jgi:hypothetical protein